MVGNQAVSWAVKLARTNVIAAYPITPQTSVVEELSEMCARGELEAVFLHTESEHSSMANCIGAALTGVRTFTATSSQGLALMHELLHWAAASRLPIVMANVNRALAPPWTIYTDQTDSLAQRDTGWMQLYCEGNQEVLDTVLQAFRVSQQVLLPSMVVLDAFVLSHTAEIVDIPEQADVDEYLGPPDYPYAIDPKKPRAYGGMMKPDCFMEQRYKMKRAMEIALDIWQHECERFAQVFGRRYDLVEPHAMKDANVAVVASGTVCGTARVAIDRLRDDGVPVGLLKMKCFRPFPSEVVRQQMRGLRRVIVIDRNYSYGHSGIFAQEIKSALYHVAESERPQIHDIIVGLAGRDVTVEDLYNAIRAGIDSATPSEAGHWLTVRV